MIYILNINLNNNNKISTELTKILGIGKFQARLLCNILNIGFDCRLRQLNQTYLYILLKQIEAQKLIVETELQTHTKKCIKELIEIKTYRGIRHIFNLPVRGQRTKTNARTQKRTKIL